jgi:hypothetical protein
VKKTTKKVGEKKEIEELSKQISQVKIETHEEEESFPEAEEAEVVEEEKPKVIEEEKPKAVEEKKPKVVEEKKAKVEEKPKKKSVSTPKIEPLIPSTETPEEIVSIYVIDNKY